MFLDLGLDTSDLLQIKLVSLNLGLAPSQKLIYPELAPLHRVRVSFMVRVGVWVKIRIKISIRARITVMVRVRGKVRVRASIRGRVRVRILVRDKLCRNLRQMNHLILLSLYLILESSILSSFYIFPFNDFFLSCFSHLPIITRFLVLGLFYFTKAGQHTKADRPR